MLNRLYIVIGVLAILALTAAFIVPGLIPWGDYRGRMEQMAGAVLGEKVRIAGDIKFSLLPQPRLHFAAVSAGPEDAPVLTVEQVEANFSLIDFLRDRYVVTRLELLRPALRFSIGADGGFDAGIDPGASTPANVSVGNAVVADGTITLADARAGSTIVVSRVNGDLRLDGRNGPFLAQGSGEVDGIAYSGRVTTGTFDASGKANVAVSVRQQDGKVSVAAEGLLTGGPNPVYTGTATYRQAPADAAAAEAAGQGDLVVTSKMELTPARLLLSDYVVVPDENRATSRLLGAAAVTLGAAPSFNAVVSGGLLALPPRDATETQAAEPYELLRLLNELPLPFRPPIPGTLGMDLAELNLRAFSLRNVRLDATAHDGGWTVRQFSGQLPGESSLRLSGEVAAIEDRVEFSGRAVLTSRRLDALAALWRRPADGNPLAGLGGGIEANVALVGETLSLSDGKLVLDGGRGGFSAQIGLGAARDIHLTADLGELNAPRSAALLALLPDLARDPAFAVSFPKGEFDLVADAMTIDGLTGRALAAAGSWDGGVLVIDRMAAGDLGGSSFELGLTAFGSLAKPEISGSGTLRVAAATAPALRRFYDAVKTPPAIADYVGRFMPLDLALRLEAPSGDGEQALALSGTAGPSEIAADAEFEAGFLRALSGKLQVKLDLKAADTAAMSAQLGLGDEAVVDPNGPMHLVALIDGHVANSLESTILVEGGADSLGFSGHVVVSNPAAFSGKGTVKLALSDPAPLARRLGLDGIGIPPFGGTATLEFSGPQAVTLSNIAGTSGQQDFTGSLQVSPAGLVSGEIATGGIEIGGLLGGLAGPAAILAEPDAIWPVGPLATGEAARRLSGRVHVTAPALLWEQRQIATELGFDLDWDGSTTRLRGLLAKLGGGALALDLGVCCAGPLLDKQVTGRVTLTDVALDGLLPEAAAAGLAGKIDVNGRFDGTGNSVRDIMGKLTGDGSYTLRELRIAGLDPGAIPAIGRLDNVLDLAPEQLTAQIVDQLDDGSFASREVTGGFTIAGGVLRSPNLGLDGDSGRLFGSLSVRLADLGLTGSYVLSSNAPAAAEALVDTGTAKVGTNLSGTLLAPERRFDVSGLVDGVMARAYEAEVERLEKLRAEDEARRRLVTEQRAQIAAERQAREAERAVRQAIEEAAAKQAAEDEAARQAEEAAAAERAAEARRAAAEAARKKAEEEARRPLDIGFGN